MRTSCVTCRSERMALPLVLLSGVLLSLLFTLLELLELVAQTLVLVYVPRGRQRERLFEIIETQKMHWELGSQSCLDVRHGVLHGLVSAIFFRVLG